MTECQYCHKDYPKGIKMHEKYCKEKPLKSSDPAGELFSKPSYPSVSPSNPSFQSPAVDIHIKDDVIQCNTTQKESKSHPILIKGPDPNFRHDEKASESDKLRRFLADAPLWTKYKPSGATLAMAKMLNPGKVYAPMIFVGENEAPQVLYFPYEPEKNRIIIPGKGYFVTPTTGLPFFFHKDYMLPLVNSPNLKDRFQLPGHFVESIRASALAEGMLQSSNEFLNEIKKYKYVAYASIAVALLALFVAAYLAYSAEKSINNLADQITNMTQVINSNKGVIIR